MALLGHGAAEVRKGKGGERRKEGVSRRKGRGVGRGGRRTKVEEGGV